ncbi:MAG: methylmalonyl Co-A mutase-associated GTPase MeaB, partial [Actinomycetota bacterium]|nr:methylmalonyl Co-A mutase-associated GTPase MeaB [Actinomycetota bacterium]
INKADRPGADDTRRDIQQMLELSTLGAWEPPIVPTVGPSGEGVDELWERVNEHRAHLQASGELQVRRAERVDVEFAEILHRSIEARVDALSDTAAADQLRTRLSAREIDPYAAVEVLLSLADGEESQPGGDHLSPSDH